MGWYGFFILFSELWSFVFLLYGTRNAGLSLADKADTEDETKRDWKIAEGMFCLGLCDAFYYNGSVFSQ